MLIVINDISELVIILNANSSITFLQYIFCRQCIKVIFRLNMYNLP